MSRQEGGWPATATLVIGQARSQNRVFWRTPIAAFFTLVLPLVMMVLFNALFDGVVETSIGEIPIRQFYTAGLAVFAAVSATYTNLVNMIPIRRDEGILKRVRSTPLPPPIYLGGAVLSALWIAVIGVVVMLGIAVIGYDLEIEPSKLPAAGLTFVIGISAFAALGLAVAALVPSASAAPAVANATILPLAFVSNIFIALEDPPRWLEVIGDIFPLKHFASAFQDAFNPLTDGAGFRWGDLAVIAAWGALGAVVAVRKFHWEPSVGATGRRSRRQPRVDAEA
ncbi:MAG: ABC transporter permease [Acidimicrobiia bacterium]|nr:ABC transporter permease [Acidimicrobiia bacterium]